MSLAFAKKLGSRVRNPQFLNPQIAQKNGSANPQFRKVPICGTPENLTNYLSPQICVFAICGTSLRTAHLWV